MCHENEMGAAKEQHPYIICRLDKQRRWNSGGTVTRPLFINIQLDISRILGRHFGSKGLAVLAVRDELNGIGSLDSGRSDYDLYVGRGRNIGICNGYRDISLTKIPPIAGRENFNQ